MYPYFTLFGHAIPAYGALCVLGLVVSTTVLFLRNRRKRLPMDDIIHTALFCVVGAFLGTKILYFILILPALIRNISLVIASPSILLHILTDGFIFYGGLFGALAMAFYYLKKYRLPIGDFADLFAPSFPLFHAFGRVGCFLAGCCHGIEMEGGIVYTQALGGPNGVPLFPVQLVEAGCNLLLFFSLLLIDRLRPKSGRLLPAYLFCYAIIRFVLEFFRGDAGRGHWAGLSTSQWISLLLLAALLLWYLRSRRKRDAPAEGKVPPDS